MKTKWFLGLFFLLFIGVFALSHTFINNKKRKNQTKIDYTEIPPYFGAEPISLLDHTQTKKNQKDIVVVIPSYNNEEFCVKNIESVLCQEYQNFRVIYIDDCSKDNTYKIAKDVFEKWGRPDRYILLHNKNRYGAMANLYRAIHRCKPNEIVVTLDGDDWFSHEKVLEWLNTVYSHNNTWLTYGQYIDYPNYTFGCNRSIHWDKWSPSTFRKHRWITSHLRTFYAGLFHQIKLEDFYYKDSFYQMAWDLSMIFPMIEMGWGHVRFIPDVLYVYNKLNPINDDKVNIKLQESLSEQIKSKKPYLPIKSFLETKNLEKNYFDVIVFSKNISSDLLKTLDSLKASLSTKNKVIIFFENKGNDNGFEKIKKDYPYKFFQIAFNAETSMSLVNKIKENINSEYILVSTDKAIFEIDSFEKHLGYLRKTKASGMHLSLQKDNRLQNLNVKGAFPLVPLFDDVYSWQYDKNSQLMSKADIFTAGIYSKKSLIEKLKKNHCINLEALLENWIKNIDQGEVRLFLDKKSCH